MVISSGGVSVGEADYTKAILEELGKSASGSWRSNRENLSLSASLATAGSAACRATRFPATLTFYQLVQPLLAKLSGNVGQAQPMRLRVRAASGLKKSPGRLDFQRGVLQRGGRRAGG